MILISQNPCHRLNCWIFCGRQLWWDFSVQQGIEDFLVGLVSSSSNVFSFRISLLIIVTHSCLFSRLSALEDKKYRKSQKYSFCVHKQNVVRTSYTMDILLDIYEMALIIKFRPLFSFVSCSSNSFSFPPFAMSRTFAALETSLESIINNFYLQVVDHKFVPVAKLLLASNISRSELKNCWISRLCSHNTFLWSDRLRPTVQRGRCGKRRVSWLSPTSTLTLCSSWTVFCTLQALCAVAGPKPKKYYFVWNTSRCSGKIYMCSLYSIYSLDTSFMMSPSKSSILPAAMRSLALWLISPAILLHWRKVSAWPVWPAASHTSTSSLQMVRPWTGAGTEDWCWKIKGKWSVQTWRTCRISWVAEWGGSEGRSNVSSVGDVSQVYWKYSFMVFVSDYWLPEISILVLGNY